MEKPRRKTGKEEEQNDERSAAGSSRNQGERASYGEWPTAKKTLTEVKEGRVDDGE